jgi:hypothetical protein
MQSFYFTFLENSFAVLLKNKPGLPIITKRGRRFRPLFVYRDYFSGNFLFYPFPFFLSSIKIEFTTTSVM